MADRVASVPEETPRRVRPSAYLASGGGTLLLVGALWLAIGAGIVAGLLAVPTAWDDFLVTVRGKSARGHVVAVLPTDAVLRGHPVSEIRFVFRDPQGKVQVATSRSAHVDLVRRARFGEVPVHFDRLRPSRARIDGTRLSPFGFFILVPLLLVLAGVAAVARGLAGCIAARRLLVNGALALGRVVDVSVSEHPLRRRRSFDVLYAFDGPGGELQGISAESEAPSRGAEVPVLFDPERPWRSLLPPNGAFVR
jgi:hypothetical protein